MTELPFSITVKPFASDDGPRTLLCLKLLRDLGKKRKVFEGKWNDQMVVIKLFSDPFKARYHIFLEWRKLKILQARGIDSPEPLLRGRSNLGWVLVTSEIQNTTNARELWDEINNYQQRCSILCRVAAQLAKHHNKGVLQRDLHLGNFLVGEDKVFTLDPAQMRFLSGPVDRRRSIGQLALLTSVLPDQQGQIIDEICRRYADVRGWVWGTSDKALFEKKWMRAKRWAVTNTLKKCMRTNRRYERFRHSFFGGVAIRDFYERGDFSQLPAGLDQLMEQGRILKRGNTCFVSVVEWMGQKVVVKRYNHKGLFHSLRHTIKRSRARRCWLHAHRLMVLDIATPRPLAYIEQFKGPVVWQSYFITEYVEAQKLSDFLEDNSKSRAERVKTIKQVQDMLARLAKFNITHGDLKPTNILLGRAGPVITDLDSMQVHRWNRSCKVKYARDLEKMASKGVRTNGRV